MKKNPFEQLGLPINPIILAPLAGVSDHPFRRVCSEKGADLTYVEMISATALVHNSVKTLEMLARHPSEGILGVQITSKTPEEMGQAVAMLDKMSFETIDINMGCPVKKVVKSGCGSAILRDPERVFATVKAACANTQKPVSAKIRLGWDHNSLNYLEVCDAIVQAGGQWITVHGRTRSDTYADPVDLEKISEIKAKVPVPVIANGNIFTLTDYQNVKRMSGADGVMISRGALGNPWLFADIKAGKNLPLNLNDWLTTVLTHLDWHEEAYGKGHRSDVCMRKHYVWYTKGWPNSRYLRENLSRGEGEQDARRMLTGYLENAIERANKPAFELFRNDEPSALEQKFLWDPKWDMDRNLDRGAEFPEAD